MNTDEKQLLAGLFERIRTAAAAPRDPEAEALIAAAVREQPYAPYLLAQAVLLQEQALKAADTRLHELEGKLASLEQAKAEPAPSFLGGIGSALFGSKSASGVPSVGSGAPAGPAAAVWGQRPAAPAYPPQQAYAQPAYAAASPQGPGFLQSAMTTAAGVAGGALLYQGISSLFHTGGGYAGGFGGYGYGMPHETVINETVYETVNQYDTPVPPSRSEWGASDADIGNATPQDASYDDSAFDSSFDSGSDDSFA